MQTTSAMGRTGEVDELFGRFRTGDPALQPRRSGQYARFRLLVAFYLERQNWTVGRLLDHAPTQLQAEKTMFSALHGAS